MPDVGRIYAVVNKYKYLVIVVAVGIIILMLPSNSEEKREEKTTFESFELESFEKRVESILENGDGIGRVQVVLTMKSGMEYVYAEENKFSTREQRESGDAKDVNRDSDSRPSILSDGSGGETPIVIKQIYPEFLGAAVVCDGADDPRVEMYITDVVSSLTGITSDRITVIKMKN